MMDIGLAFSYMFSDPKWLSKLLIGAVIILGSFLLSPILVGILGFFVVAGYTLEVLRNVRKGSQSPLPEWRDHWGQWLVLGIKLAIVVLVWSLPGIALGIPGSIGNTIAAEGGRAAWFGLTIGAFFSCLSLLWYIIVALVSPALYIRMAETQDISSGFEFNEILQFTRNNIADILVAVVVIFILGLVAAFAGTVVGTMLCVIGLAITLPAVGLYVNLVQSHLYAQIGNDKGRRQPATPEPTQPAEPVTAEVVDTGAASQ
ncbi:MAG: DUF4013 domain-containing protein [Chloroflexota bacterium]|nr:DUF4013 domain-containing protein [Chloroflexota bacterium]